MGQLLSNPVFTALAGSLVGSLIPSIVGLLTSYVNNRTLLRIKQVDQQMNDQKLILKVAMEDHQHTSALMKEYAEKFGQDVHIFPAFPRMIFYKEMNELLKKQLTPAELKKAIRGALEHQSSLEQLIQDYNREKGKLAA